MSCGEEGGEREEVDRMEMHFQKRMNFKLRFLMKLGLLYASPPGRGLDERSLV